MANDCDLWFWRPGLCIGGCSCLIWPTCKHIMHVFEQITKILLSNTICGRVTEAVMPAYATLGVIKSGRALRTCEFLINGFRWSSGTIIDLKLITWCVLKAICPSHSSTIYYQGFHKKYSVYDGAKLSLVMGFHKRICASARWILWKCLNSCFHYDFLSILYFALSINICSIK